MKTTAAAMSAAIPTMPRIVPSRPRPLSPLATAAPGGATGTVTPERGLPFVITGTPVSFTQRLLASKIPAVTT
jgi:hypothetical protein